MRTRQRSASTASQVQEGLRHAAGDADGPLVVPVVAIGKRHEESGIGDALHVREKPLRVDRSLCPLTVPASRMND